MNVSAAVLIKIYRYSRIQFRCKNDKITFLSYKLFDSYNPACCQDLDLSESVIILLPEHE